MGASQAPQPDGMRRALAALRAAGEPLALVELARRLLALVEPPAAPLARRLVAALLGARPENLPERFEPHGLRPGAERAVAATSLAQARFIVVDLETTGLSSERDAILEIGAVRIGCLRVETRFETLLRPPGPGPLSAAIVKLTGIDDAILALAPPAHRALEHFVRFLDEAPGAAWVAHNARFDHRFLCRAFESQWGRMPEAAVLCTQRLSRRLLPSLGRYDLDHVCAQFGIRNRARHRALGDAEATARAWIELLMIARDQGLETVGDLLDLQERPMRRRRRPVRSSLGSASLRA